MTPTTYTPRYREPVVIDVPEDAAEAAAPVACPVFRCTLAGRGCAARHLSGVAGHPSHGACAACPGGRARAALLDVRAPTPAEVLRQMTHPGGVPVFEERYMSDATDKILAHLGNGPASAGDIRRATGLGDSVVKAAVQTLKGQGRVSLEGHGKAARWSLAPAAAAVAAPTPPAVDLPPAVDVVPVVEERAPGGVEIDVPVTRRAPVVPQAVVDAKGIPARTAARRRMPLDGADAQALEGALAMTERERDDAAAQLGIVKANCDTWAAAARRLHRAITGVNAAGLTEADVTVAEGHIRRMGAELDTARREAESAKGLQAEAEREAAEWRKKAEAVAAEAEQAKRIAHGAAVAVGTIVEALQAVGVDPYNADEGEDDEQAGDFQMVDPEDLAEHIKAEVERLKNEAFRDGGEFAKSDIVAAMGAKEGAAAMSYGLDLDGPGVGRHPLQAARERLAVVEAELATVKRDLARAIAASERTSNALWALKHKLQDRADTARREADAADEALNDVLTIPDPDMRVPF
ncbi:MAG: hypothetical protein EKK55_16215 [Rhodocyclaceae bacterium]|nr:MAG: hypothetical protein EKK55_16215 [Rhodocyclaceae bacterium]